MQESWAQGSTCPVYPNASSSHYFSEVLLCLKTLCLKIGCRSLPVFYKPLIPFYLFRILSQKQGHTFLCLWSLIHQLVKTWENIWLPPIEPHCPILFKEQKNLFLYQMLLFQRALNIISLVGLSFLKHKKQRPKLCLFVLLSNLSFSPKGKYQFLKIILGDCLCASSIFQIFKTTFLSIVVSLSL